MVRQDVHWEYQVGVAPVVQELVHSQGVELYIAVEKKEVWYQQQIVVVTRKVVEQLDTDCESN